MGREELGGDRREKIGKRNRQKGRRRCRAGRRDRSTKRFCCLSGEQSERRSPEKAHMPTAGNYTPIICPQASAGIN